jgi:hypothetical protein
MKRVVLIGFDPATVDYSDPALPPGMNAEKIPSWRQACASRYRRAGLAPRSLLHQARRDRSPDD